MRKAFTLIEIMVSVVLIGMVVLGIVKLQKENSFMAKYISGRVQSELSNTLFLRTTIFKYNRNEKDAYTLLTDMKIRKDKSRKILRNIKRKISISDTLIINELPISIDLRAVMLKGGYSARFYRIKP